MLFIRLKDIGKMPSKYLTAPLIIIAILALISLFGLGSNTGTFGLYSQSTSFSNVKSTQVYLYDSGGNAVMFAQNHTAVNPNESISLVHLYLLTSGGLGAGGIPVIGLPVATKYAGFTNSSGLGSFLNGAYELFTDTHGQNALLWTNVNSFANPAQSTNGNINTNINLDIGAMIAILSIVMVVAALIGVQVVGSGASNDTTSAVILKFGAMLGIWGVFSGLSYTLLFTSGIPLNLGSYFYLVLTFIFVVGLVDTIGHPSH
jgi:hypothetical protein